MAHQYNFSQLDPREFEFLCRDLLQRKISNETGTTVFFNSFSEGADRGIDAIFEDKTHKIVLQCKRYSDFNSLYHQLKNLELPKVQDIKPTQYIVATSYNLSKKQIDKIYALFEPYMQGKNDIIGQAMLNNMLACYPDIELNYPRLYLSNATVLNRLLQANVYNQSLDKLKGYKDISKYYVSDSSFQQALETLEKKRFVLISGEPGVGKSTLAGMLSLYYVQQEYEFIFLRSTVVEGDGSVWDDQRKQVFLFDDFLGSVTFEGFDRNEDRRLLDFIGKITTYSNKLLIITTREYVFRQAEAKYPELKNLEFTKCMIRQRAFTSSFKINILYNYLYYSSIEWKHIEPFLFRKAYEEIIHHRNFTPRLIADYIVKDYNKNNDSYSLYVGLKKYLDNPYAYWERVFRKLNNNAQMLLLILAMTEEPVIEEFLFETFVGVGKHRKVFEKGFEKDSFEQALAELSESFISILHNPETDTNEETFTIMDYSLIFTSFRSSRFIEFQNPSIKDFTIDYLRKREDLITFLLKGCVLFNQLFHIFTTRKDDEHIEDDEATYPYHVGKIQLSSSLSTIIIGRAIHEFDQFPIAKVKRINWESDVSTFHLNSGVFDNRMEKLQLLCYYFPLDQYREVRDFVITRYQQLLDEDSVCQEESDIEKTEELRILSLDERLTQADVIKVLYPFTEFDPMKVIKSYYKNIRFSKEFVALHYLGKLFPDAYRQVVTANIKEIRRQIKEMIYDDIDHYLWEGTQDAEEAISELIYDDLDELMEVYNFKLSKKLMRNINDMAGRKLFEMEDVEKTEEFWEDDQDNPIPQKQAITRETDKQKTEGYKIALERLRPHWDYDWEQDEAFDYIRSKISDTTHAEYLLDWIKAYSCFEDFLGNTQSVDLLLNYLEIHEDIPINEYTLYNDILAASKLQDSSLKILQNIAFDLYVNELFVFRRDTFENISKNDLDSSNCQGKINSYNNILIQQDIWYRFVNIKFHIFLAAQYIANLPVTRKIEFYQSFQKMHNDIYYENVEILWRFCFETDKRSFCDYFIIPIIKKELAKIYREDIEEMTLAFLKEGDYQYDFGYYHEEESFEIGSCGGGDALIEDIFNTFDWGVNYPFWEIGNCFNITYIKNPSLIKYIQMHCTVKDGEYSIYISRELSKREFRELLKLTEVTNIVSIYVNALQNLLIPDQSPLF